MSLWLIMFGMMVVTYGIRLSAIMLLGEANMPAGINRMLRFVPPVAFSALIFPALLVSENKLDVSPGNVRLLAGIAAVLVAWKSRNTLLAIAVGMVLLWVLQSIF